MDKKGVLNIFFKMGYYLAMCLCVGFLAFASCSSFVSSTAYQKPIEHSFVVKASIAGWQDSGIKVKKNQVISCYAEGKWGDYFGMYGPDGNSENIKTHHGVSAPAYSLLMRVSNDTNVVWAIGRSTSIVTKTSGTLFFRSNTSLTNGLNGQVKVYCSVADDDDGDGLSNYEEVYIWKTDPHSIDTDGNGFSDYEDVMERRKVLGLFY